MWFYLRMAMGLVGNHHGLKNKKFAKILEKFRKNLREINHFMFTFENLGKA